MPKRALSQNGYGEHMMFLVRGERWGSDQCVKQITRVAVTNNSTSCNLMQRHANSCTLMQHHATSRILTTTHQTTVHANSCNLMQPHITSSNGHDNDDSNGECNHQHVLIHFRITSGAPYRTSFAHDGLFFQTHSPQHILDVFD